VLLALPAAATAQRDQFFSALLEFHKSSAGLYGDEGPSLMARLDAMSEALDAWNRDIRDAETELRVHLVAGAVQTQLQVHTLLAARYLERGRFADAVREFDENIRLDPRRASFHRLRALALQAMSRQDEAADAFRTTWLLDPADPQNAYRLIASRSAQTTSGEIDRALETLATVEGELVRRTRLPASPFLNVYSINDAAGGGMAFVPAAYARGFSLIVRGELDSGLAALRTALAGDPLIVDPASGSEALARGRAALREGRVTAAIEQLEAAAARTIDSSEAHRMLGTAYLASGDIVRSVQHLRDAVRLNPRDERSWLALARTLDETGSRTEAEDALRAAVTELPSAGALRWRLSTTLEKRQLADQADLTLVAEADQMVLLAGRSELYRAVARLAQLNLDYDAAAGLLEHAVAVTPNNAAAHQALGRAYLEDGRETEGYAELVVALLIDPDAVSTLTELGRLHLSAGRAVRATDVLERAVAVEPTNALAVQALAAALVRAGRLDEGKRRLEESEQLQARAVEIERRARTAAVLALEAELRAGERRFSEAIDLWRQIIASQPGSAARQLRLADALVAAKRHEEAAAEYVAAIALGAGADAHRRLAEVYDTLGRPADSARERATYVDRRLEELRLRAAGGGSD
jgi:tetratricopeptide (TPR) repeat protein